MPETILADHGLSLCGADLPGTVIAGSPTRDYPGRTALPHSADAARLGMSASAGRIVIATAMAR